MSEERDEISEIIRAPVGLHMFQVLGGQRSGTENKEISSTHWSGDALWLWSIVNVSPL